jgi:hypothetical protein
VVATTEASRALYRSCDAPQQDAPEEVLSRLPQFIVIGAQKAATSSIAAEFRRRCAECQVCFSRGEPHLFDQPSWKFKPVGVGGLRNYAARFGGCEKGHIRAEKTPNYMLVAHAPLRACAVVPRAKVIAILRNPVDRAFSGFFQGAYVLERAVGPRDERAFDRVAQVEMSITRACGLAPQRRGTETRQQVERAEAAYVHCCAYNTGRLGYHRWPGCGCRSREGRYCLGTGDSRAMPVRKGVYVRLLENWLTFFRASDLLVVDFLYLVQEPERVLRAIAHFGHTGRLQAPSGRATQAPKAALIQRNSRSAGHSMNSSTRERLAAFYEPYNRELYARLGHDFGWE